MPLRKKESGMFLQSYGWRTRVAVTAKCTLLRKNPSGPQQSPSLGLLPGKEHCRCLGPRPDLPSGSSQGSNRNEPGRPGVSDISRPEADRYCVVSLTCGIKKKKGQILTNRLWKSGCQGVGGGGSRERLVRRHELSPIGWTRSGEPTCTMVTVT